MVSPVFATRIASPKDLTGVALPVGRARAPPCCAGSSAGFCASIGRTRRQSFSLRAAVNHL
eukprot:scaffold442_cov268-Pinguiococcus_pyrenoidosus.AAC.112